ncbi:hypothetical protein [Cellulomonas sp. URHE0023]|nr:hypothetical protein [Cellulomonas sp. URHE0023]
MSRSLKSALAVVAVALTIGVSGTSAAVAADSGIVYTNGGATGCCRLPV